MYKFNNIAEYILKSDYLLDNETPEDMFMRVSKVISSVEKNDEDREYWTDRFFTTMKDGYWIPATPFLMNAGVNNMFSSCFVVGGLEDDLHSIFSVNERSAIITKMGGGIGLNISKLREKDAYISSTKGKSTGAISFMKVFNTTLDVVMQARRRGAGIIVMDIYHADIESFITVKSDHGEINNFNISVVVDDAFMEAVKNNQNIELKSPLGYITKTINAKELFNKIVTNARYHAEPGLILKSAINRDNPCINLGEIDSVNACVTGDTLVLTEKGYLRIDSLVNTNIKVWNGVEFSEVIPVITNTNQEIYLIKFSDGSELKCTPYHKFYIKNNYRKVAVIKEAKDLIIKDKLDKYNFPVIQGIKQLNNKSMYTLGVYSGDGFDNTEKDWQCIYLYDEKRNLINYIDSAHTRDEDNSDRTFIKLSPIYKQYTKEFVPSNTYSIENRLNWLAGIIDTDGTLNSKDGAICISSIKRNFLKDIKLMLNTLGCNGTLSLFKKATIKEMPFDATSTKEYQCQDCYRLTINAGNVYKLMQLGLNTHRVKLVANPNRDASKFIYVTEITKQPIIEEKVYCFNEPKKHKGCFNGIITGQCGEIPLRDNEACNLSALNLQRYIDEDGSIDFEKLDFVTETIVRFLDNSIDINNFPDELIHEAVLMTRKLGIGVMGLNPMLTIKGYTYDSEKGRIFAKKVLKQITDTAQKYSQKLIEEGRELPKGWYGSTFEEQGIKIRNLSVTSGQPTGATQLLMNEICASSGIEPYFSICYKRKVRDNEYILVNSLFKNIGYQEGWLNDKVIQKILDNNGSCQGIKEVSKKWQKLFKTSLEISWEDHVKMQAELQSVTTNALSKTINLSQNATVEDVYNAYMMAWELGCKGATVYVQNSREGQVLSAENKKEEYKLDYIQPISRSTLGKTYGTTIDKKSACGKMYITINRDKKNNIIESFVHVGKSGICKSNIDGINRLVSLSLRSGIKVDEIIDQLKGIICPACTKVKAKGDKIDGTSCADIIGRVLEEEYKSILKVENKQKEVQEKEYNNLLKCPECSEYTLTKYDGCVQCTNCNWSRCS